ncbi:glycerophosphodiester phosphodiesterase [Candidatus Bathyarchaeota archaeon]|nr:glycerophosphodiester phosphodiesterase [Candidatus Bathyarchaeota archaeon]
MVLRIGHRGAKGHAPENTLKSFSKAVELGCDMTELDVHLGGSGELVVIHDETVDRTTDGSGAVANHTLRELKRLDAGQGERIPTLEEVLKLLKGRIMLNIELKGLGTAEPVYELMQYVGWRRDDLLITSFEWDMLTQYRASDPDARLGPLTYGNLKGAMNFAETVGAYSINPYYGHINAKYVEEAHTKGFKVYPWTVNNPEDIAQVIKLGVDGVISDYPDRVLHQ